MYIKHFVDAYNYITVLQYTVQYTIYEMFNLSTASKF